MIRCILSLLIILLTWTGTITLGLAATQDNPPMTEKQLERGETIAKKAIEATQKGDFAKAEAYWTQLVEEFPNNPAVWSNRGNARVSQNKLEVAIDDFSQAIELAPDAPDPYLNRGTALEAQGKYEAAIADYNRVLELNPQDAMAYNNRGNAESGEGDWEKALTDYQKAVEIAPNFAFARANAALVYYQMGKKGEAITEMRNLVRKYPMFPDMRAALTAVLWNMGQQGEAESHWVAAVGMDNRYQDLNWVKNIRRWPPQMVAALDKFLNLK
ncbi:MAG: tetratricopeptide repeat protein [Crocosphaera sp.]|nr:tetratricopeptide repeat protein [Crocosphaera sp.]